VLNVIIFTCLFFANYPEKYSTVDWNFDISQLLRTIVLYPGQIINNTQIRGLLPVYPVIVFYFAVSKRIKEVFKV
jgi:hypothetical protein